MAMALGAGTNIRDRKIEALCSIPVEVAIQQTFFILRPIMNGPLGAQDVIYKDPTQSFWALVRLLSCFLVDLQYLSCAQGGKRDIPSTLGFREERGIRLHWSWAPPSRNSEVLVPMFFLRTTYYANRL